MYWLHFSEIWLEKAVDNSRNHQYLIMVCDCEHSTDEKAVNIRHLRVCHRTLYGAVVSGGAQLCTRTFQQGAHWSCHDSDWWWFEFWLACFMKKVKIIRRCFNDKYWLKNFLTFLLSPCYDFFLSRDFGIQGAIYFMACYNALIPLLAMVVLETLNKKSKNIQEEDKPALETTNNAQTKPKFISMKLLRQKSYPGGVYN